MLLLYILLGIILLLTIILLLPIRFKARHEKDWFVALYIAFVKLQLVPPKPKKPKKKKKSPNDKSENKTTDQKKKKQNIIQKNGLPWLIEMVERTAKLASGVLKDFFRKLIIKKLLLSIIVAEDDAAKTAVNYGYYCSVVYPAIGIITKNAKCKKYGIDILPDFDEKATSSFELNLEVKIRAIWLVLLLLKYGKELLSVISDFNK